MMSTRSRFVLALAACLVLAGCGFQPLYGTRVGETSVSHHLASVSVVQPSTRLGQLIRNEIVSTIAPAGQQGEPLYVLELLPSATAEVTIRDFNTGVLRRALRVEAAFRLTQPGVDGELYSGRTFSQASYDRTIAPFSDRQARIAAEERAARQVGADITTRLAAFFASR